MLVFASQHSISRLFGSRGGLAVRVPGTLATNIVRFAAEVTGNRSERFKGTVAPQKCRLKYTWIYMEIYISQYVEWTGRWAQPRSKWGFFIACSVPWSLSARFRTTARSTEWGNNRVWSDERPPKWVASRWRRRKSVTVPGVASLQARAPARREWGSEFQSLGPTAQ